MMVHVMPHSLPWIVKMFEENGVGLTFSEISVPTQKQLQPPRFDDPYMVAAETWLKRTSTTNVGYKAQIFIEKLQQYNMDGMVFGLFDFDRWMGSDHRLLAKIVEEKTKLPADRGGQRISKPITRVWTQTRTAKRDVWTG